MRVIFLILNRTNNIYYRRIVGFMAVSLQATTLRKNNTCTDLKRYVITVYIVKSSKYQLY